MVDRTWVHRTRSRYVTTLAIAAGLVFLSFGGAAALAQTFNSGSTGADGAFNPTTNTTLALPPDGVFNFTTMNIPAGVTVTFTRNTTNTPVTMLASGNVTIAGTIDVSGAAGGPPTAGTSLGSNGGRGGPGGFDGGTGGNNLVSTIAGTGLGPGGGTAGFFNPANGFGHGGGGAGFAAPGGSAPAGATAGGPAYGTVALLPPIGGSGGGGGGTGAPSGRTGGGGGGGGGALLIGSSGTIALTGTLSAYGGNGGAAQSTFDMDGSGGGGSGGAIRIVATTITGSGGSITVTGGAGGINRGGNGSAGRIRIEAYTNTATINFAGVGPSVSQPGVAALPGAPSLQIASVAGVAAPAQPTGSFAMPDITLPASTTNPMTVTLGASHIPLGTTITVRVTPLTGGASSAVSTGLAGTLTASMATASVTIPTDQTSVISASATFTLTALPGAGPLYAAGEEVDRIQVAAVLGGRSTITYITKSGREVLADALLDR